MCLEAPVKPVIAPMLLKSAEEIYQESVAGDELENLKVEEHIFKQAQSLVSCQHKIIG